MNAAQIAQELKTLEAKNRSCAEQLRVLYQRYLKELSNAASQQLMTVCYHLCTENYPEAFLGLSLRDRQVLQDKVRGQGEKLRQQLSLEGLLLPEPGDMAEGEQPRVAVIKAELTGDDLEVLTSALEGDNSDRILALLREKEIDLPFDLEAAMQQQSPSANRDEDEQESSAAEKPDMDQSQAHGGPEEPDLQERGAELEALEDLESLETSTKAGDKQAVVFGTAPEVSQEKPSVIPNAVNEADLDREQPKEDARAATESQSASGLDANTTDSATPNGRSLGRRFLEDILSRRSLERRRREDDEISGVAGEGSLRIEDDAHQVALGEGGDRAGEVEPSLEEDDLDLENGFEANFDDNNGFDPNFEPPPAEDRYEPTPLKSSDKLDISPGVLASALAAEGEDDRRGMLMRPAPYDGTTELSDEALSDPFALIRWVDRMERGISQRLRQSSQRMTRCLEKSRILNNELPDGLLEAAVRPDGDHEDDSDGSMPHVLRLKLNAAGKEEGRPRKGQAIRIVAIYLRLSEIEFSTPGVMAWRNQLRSQVKQLRRLSKEYKDCKHAQDVVKAQELWRQGWGND